MRTWVRPYVPATQSRMTGAPYLIKVGPKRRLICGQSKATLPNKSKILLSQSHHTSIFFFFLFLISSKKLSQTFVAREGACLSARSVVLYAPLCAAIVSSRLTFTSAKYGHKVFGAWCPSAPHIRKVIVESLGEEDCSQTLKRCNTPPVVRTKMAPSSNKEGGLSVCQRSVPE